MSTIDSTKANAAANVVAQNLKTLTSTLDKAGSAAAQTAAVKNIQKAMTDDPDSFSAGGAARLQAINSGLNSLLQDVSDGASGQAPHDFSGDLNALTENLNAAGIQFDTTAGQGHFDQGTVVGGASNTVAPAAGGINFTAEQVNAAATKSPPDMKALADYLQNLGDNVPANGWDTAQSPDKMKTLKDALTANPQSRIDVANAFAQFSSSALNKDGNSTATKASYDSLMDGILKATDLKGVSGVDMRGQAAVEAKTVDAASLAAPQSAIDKATSASPPDYKALGKLFGEWGNGVATNDWQSKNSPKKLHTLMSALDSGNKDNIQSALQSFSTDALHSETSSQAVPDGLARLYEGLTKAGISSAYNHSGKSS